jgi:hypothetical protein
VKSGSAWLQEILQQELFMSLAAREMREQGLKLLSQARALCDHATHKHHWDSDGPGYTCLDCGEYGYGLCPPDWPCPRRAVAALKDVASEALELARPEEQKAQAE